MKSIDIITTVLLIVGGLNWGLVGLLHFDLVATLFGDASLLSRLVYMIVGIGAIYRVMRWKAAQQQLAPARA